jgi:hypothetical protein
LLSKKEHRFKSFNFGEMGQNGKVYNEILYGICMIVQIDAGEIYNNLTRERLRETWQEVVIREHQQSQGVKLHDENEQIIRTRSVHSRAAPLPFPFKDLYFWMGKSGMRYAATAIVEPLTSDELRNKGLPNHLEIVEEYGTRWGEQWHPMGVGDGGYIVQNGKAVLSVNSYVPQGIFICMGDRGTIIRRLRGRYKGYKAFDEEMKFFGEHINAMVNAGIQAALKHGFRPTGRVKDELPIRLTCNHFED